jgi:hypothetical protein
MRVASSFDSVTAACEAALALAPDHFPPDLPTNELLSEAPEWYPFELRAWEIGEKIRQALSANRKLRGDSAVQENLLRVVLQRNLRRGRQPFVTNLAFKSAQPIAKYLAIFLNDPDIDGQVVDALLKMQAAGYSAEVASLTQSRYRWIRTLAQKYLRAYPAPNSRLQPT